MRGTTFRRAGIVAAAVSAALILSACSGGGTEAGSDAPELSDEPVTITLSWWGGDARAELTQQAIDAFEEEHPNITVEPQYADWTGYWDQLATATAAGDSADVVQMDELYLASYGTRGALYDLGGDLVDTTDFPAEIVKTGYVDDAQYAVPIGMTTYAMVANADLFEQYGIELPDDETWTWDDYAALAKEITEKSGGAIHGSSLIGGWDIGSVRYWGRQFGSEVFDGTKVTLDPEALTEMWQTQLDMIADGGMESADAIVESQTAGLAGSSMATGKVALGTLWNTQITAVTAASGADLRLLKLPEPKGEDPNFYKPSMFWAVSSQSEHPAEAALLVDFLVNSEAAGEIIKTERGIPANDSIRAFVADSLEPTDQQAVEFLDRVTPGPAFTTPNGASAMEGIFQRYTQEVLAGQTSPEDAAKATIAELQAEVDAAN
ncbi:ABC transporter substrate-binding protein [Agromyces sp. LHK192]|uniref:ABC transporter substrate-binding protein n=1 Tax=Agromyces sp. LHK192 TaxID=2498704 RepID=UPI000FDAC504|nr:sugar ABC transporter substrate-binding protein [Agromyces sp. LHK192]